MVDRFYWGASQLILTGYWGASQLNLPGYWTVLFTSLANKLEGDRLPRVYVGAVFSLSCAPVGSGDFVSYLSVAVLLSLNCVSLILLFLLLFLVMSGRVRRDVLSVASGSKLQPSLLQDSLGPHIVITCGSVSGKLYLSKLDESKKPLPMCICVNGNWYSPLDVESLAGKKAKKWKQSLYHLDKPLSDYILSGSHVRTGQQGSYNANVTVVDNTSASGSVVGGHVSDNESVSVSPGGLTGLSDTLPVASQGGFVSPQTTCPAVPTSQSEQFRSSIDASVPVTNRHKPLLVDTVLPFIAAYCLKGDTDSLKKIVVERFSNDNVEVAKRLCGIIAVLTSLLKV